MSTPPGAPWPSGADEWPGTERRDRGGKKMLFPVALFKETLSFDSQRKACEFHCNIAQFDQNIKLIVDT